MTLKRMTVRNFTVFPAADLDFAAGLNVVVGANGTGKSHVLKLGYSVIAAYSQLRRRPTAGLKQGDLADAIDRKLSGVFKPDHLGRLVRRGTDGGRCQVAVKFDHKSYDVGFSFDESNEAVVSIEKMPLRTRVKPPVFLPPRELLSIAPEFVAVYETRELRFEETWRDTCLLLEAPVLKGPGLDAVRPLLQPLLHELDARSVSMVGSAFYLNMADGRLEAHLVAEGHRKLAMLVRLIATGALTQDGCLFWDEPEANLNPKVIKQVARTILQLCVAGIQVFVATHSLFLMRELDILLKRDEFKGVKPRFLGLRPGESGVQVKQGDSIDDIGEIDALDEELMQSDRYMAAEAVP